MAIKRFEKLCMSAVLFGLAACDAETGSGLGGGVTVGGGSGGVGGGVGLESGRVGLGVGTGGVFLGLGLGSSTFRADSLLAEGAAMRALEYEKSGTIANWSNPDTGSSGSFTPLNSYRSAEGLDCRDFEQSVRSGDRVERTRGTACRRPNGSWYVTRSG